MATPETHATRCTFAHIGTYGHECGRPALFVGIRPSEHTTSGTYFARRCAACRELVGGENVGLKDWQPFDPSRHVNVWS